MSPDNGRSESSSYLQFGDNNRVSYAASSPGSESPAASPFPIGDDEGDVDAMSNVYDLSAAFEEYEKEQSLNSSPAMSFRGNELEQTTDSGWL